MIITFQILMLILIVLSFIGAVAEKDNEKFQYNLTTICVAGVVGFVVLTLLA